VNDAWMSRARRDPATIDGGQLKGGAPRAVWLTLTADPGVVSADSAAYRLDQLGRPGHLVWNPRTGELVQQIPILRAGRALGWPEGLQQGPPGPEESGTIADHACQRDELPAVNTEGRLCVQICVVGYPWQPFTCEPMPGLEEILDWLDSWGISRDWAAGPPAAFPHGWAAPASRRLWARGGHFGASQVPGSPAAGPGAIDIGKLMGRPLPEPAQLGGNGQAQVAELGGILGAEAAAASLTAVG
jgi:hypothetical protein